MRPSKQRVKTVAWVSKYSEKLIYYFMGLTWVESTGEGVVDMGIIRDLGDRLESS